MKQFFIYTLAVLFLAACNNGPKGEKAATGDAEKAADLAGVTYTIDAEKSVINWSGSKPTSTHTGTIKVSEGSISAKDGAITGGSFTIDMNTIVNTDLEGDKKGYLEAHLKGTASGKEDDFFNVAKYPTAKFEITSVIPVEGEEGVSHEIAGNLTLKDVTKNVTFKANVTAGASNVIATSQDFTIDRTEWGIKFLAKVLGIPADKAVSDNIGLKIDLVANAVK